MDIVIVILLLGVAALVGAAAVYIPREIERNSPQGPSLNAGGMQALQAELETRFQAEIERFRGAARETVAEIDRDLDRLRTSLAASVDEQNRGSAQLRAQVDDSASQSIDALRTALRELRLDHERELAELRGAAQAYAPAPAHHVDDAALRAVLLDLNAQLTRLEARFGASVDPVLLPGEPIHIPDHLPSTALNPEAWREVGDAVFTFAETYAAARIAIPPDLADQLSAFVTTAREALTQGIFPSLQAANADPAAQAQVQAGAAQLGAGIDRAQDALAVAWQQL